MEYCSVLKIGITLLSIGMFTLNPFTGSKISFLNTSDYSVTICCYKISFRVMNESFYPLRRNLFNVAIIDLLSLAQVKYILIWIRLYKNKRQFVLLRSMFENKQHL